jgi:ankyrin repeat protein
VISCLPLSTGDATYNHSQNKSDYYNMGESVHSLIEASNQIKSDITVRGTFSIALLAYAHLWLLIDNGANIDAEAGRHGTALKAASAEGHKEVVQLLLDNGANVNAEGGHYGSPFQAASPGGHKETVQLLLDKGADVDARGGVEGTALQIASWRGHKEIVQPLRDNGVKVNAEDGPYSTSSRLSQLEAEYRRYKSLGF